MKKKNIVLALKEEFNIENEEQLVERLKFLRSKKLKNKEECFETEILQWYYDKLYAFRNLRDDLLRPFSEISAKVRFSVLRHRIEKKYNEVEKI